MKTKYIEELAVILKKYSLNRLILKNKNLSVEINKTYNSKNDETITPKNEHIKIIKSPMIGTFYNSPAPNKPPFVNIGDKIKLGDTLGIIESMKMMHNIKSKYTGTITNILVKNKTLVEYEQNLFIIKNV